MGLTVLGWVAFGVAATIIWSLRQQLARFPASASTPAPDETVAVPAAVNGNGVAHKRAVEIKPREDGRWVRQKEGAKRPTSVHETKADAKRAADAQAKREKTDVIVRTKDGRVELRRSFADISDRADA